MSQATLPLPLPDPILIPMMEILERHEHYARWLPAYCDWHAGNQNVPQIVMMILWLEQGRPHK